MSSITLRVLGALLFLSSGCALQQINSKTKVGSEWQHRGANSTNHIRYHVEQGFDFKWDKGISTGISYRRRDVDNGTGDHDNGVWFDFGFPIWKAAKKEDRTAERIQRLERRLAELERGSTTETDGMDADVASATYRRDRAD